MKKMKNLKAGKTVILFSLVLFIFYSCSFLDSFSEDENNGIQITSLTLAKQALSVSVSEMAYISVNMKPADVQKDIKLNWSYDSNIITADTDSAWGVTIKGLKEGQTNLKCSYGGYEATCIITVKGFAENYEETIEPYIYSSTSIIQTSPGITEKVYVSLYGGSAADIDGYSWTLDNAGVCSIEPAGQYCLITAKDAGYARIKITHAKAAYPYYMGVYVFSDATKVSYITTSANILTMNLADDEQTISVSLVNGKDTSSDSSFAWEVVNDGSDCPIRWETNGNKAVITPFKAGSCTLRVTHPDASYPLEILCRVISVVKNVYIQPDKTMVTLSGNTEATVKSVLENINTGEYDVDAYTYTLDDYNVAEIVGYVGNEVMLKGKANGSCKLLIAHEKAAYTREVLLVVNGQLTDAVDSSCYITTSQNYIRMKAGGSGTSVDISLKGGEDGDENNFVWSIKSVAADGSANDVVSMDTAHGNVNYARSALQTYAHGQAFIEPQCAGTAVITVSHPKVVYPTEILVKVLSEDAILDEPLYFTGNGIIRILNGESEEYTVLLKGENKKTGDDNDIEWKCDNTKINISASANVAEIKAPSSGIGNTVSTLTISHSKADADKKVLVLTADTEEELENMKALYSDKLYYNFEVGDAAYCSTDYVGFDKKETVIDADGNETEKFVPYDFSTAVWKTSDSSVCSVEKITQNPLSARITGLKAGTAVVAVSVTDSEGTYTCEYAITVYPKGTIQTEPEIYFTTSQNVVNLSGAGKESTIRISAINLTSSEYSKIDWTSSDESVATVIGNGLSANITAVSEGEAVISASHEKSQNTLKIYVRVGSEYVIPDAKPVVYISAADVLTMLKDDPAQKLTAVLMNFTETDTSGFSFEIDNEQVAAISSQSVNGTAFIKPVSSGQAEITISHTQTSIVKKVLVVVGNSSEELKSFTYLTTSSNVVAVGEGNTKTVSVSVKNSDTVIVDGYTWSSSDASIVDVTGRGSTAVLTGNSIGTAVIEVKNKNCSYPLQIIAQCVDPIAAAANPYIQLTSSVITVNVSSSYTSVSADLVGGSEKDFSDFVWTSSDSSVCVCYGQNEVGKIRALKSGTTYITVSHPKAQYSAQLLVVCDEVKESECYISVPSSIISMKPTDSSQTITANLINGSATDKYNFTWSLDVYDIVDFVYSANVCTITPLQQGQAVITIHHPKSAYDQQIAVTVQEYTTFAFPDDYTSITQGNVSFKTMQVPTTKVATYVEYSVDNPDICSITGTKTTAQITAVKAGTTTVRAKLVASSTGVSQASAEMMVYVKEAAVNACYISAASTIYTVNKGKSQTLSASISGTGIAESDRYNLKWTTSDTDVINITGVSSDGTVTGQSIYITALKAGEALITCSHEKAASDLMFYVLVPGSGTKSVTLNKSYITLTKGSSGTTLKATIENAESSNDYNDLIWTVSSSNNEEVCRVMGNGQNVTIYPINVGEAEVMAQLPDSPSTAKCTVLVQAGKSFTFEQSGGTVQPFHSKKYKYTVSPPDANLTWTINQGDDYFSFNDLGCDEKGVGYVEIEGIKEGSGTLVCLTDGGAKGQMSIKVDWNYEFKIYSTRLSGSPDNLYVVEYKVSPADAVIDVAGNGLCEFSQNDDGFGNGRIEISPHTEGSDAITIKAKNPNDSNKIIGSYNVDGTFYYDSITVKYKKLSDVAYADNTKTAWWSDFENDTITLGDGEKLTFLFEVSETKLKDLKISAALKSKKDTNILLEPGAVSGQFILSHKTDFQSPAYRINKGYRPTYKGSVSYPDGTPIKLDDFREEWASDDYHWWNLTGDHNKRKAWFYLRNDKTSSRLYEIYSGEYEGGTSRKLLKDKSSKNNDWGVIRDTSLDGTCYSVEKFQNYLWYYVPAWEKEYGGNDKLTFVHEYGEIDTDHIDAAYYDVTPDTAIVEETQADVLEVSFEHNGKERKKSYLIYVVKRNSACTQR
ncbi:MAG: Ig-like domain-containing protein [Bacteroides sp.]|nr:Ig-like domain-containing protein [Prevotella sp.]MCM1407024.1 Ig-like domain-containing protein [Treponema brennaborense]MCM1470176.1 Ig-like domain-containing protein [Bacteroides sp.]